MDHHATDADAESGFVLLIDRLIELVDILHLGGGILFIDKIDIYSTLYVDGFMYCMYFDILKHEFEWNELKKRWK